MGRPKTFEAVPLDSIYREAAEQKQKELARLQYGRDSLGRILEALKPIYEKEDGHLRLFTPSYQRNRKNEVV